MSQPDDEAEIEASRAPLLDHLIELRRRLIVSAIALAAGFVLCFVFATQLYVLMLQPLERASALLAVQRAGGAHGPFDLLLAMTGLKSLAGVRVQQPHLIFTAPLEFFFVKVKLAAFGAVAVTFPILAWQLYRFVAPGLYRRERRAFLPFLIASPVLFVLGGALVYFVMLPFVLWFALNQQISASAGVSVELLPKVSDYFSLVLTLLLGFGFCFQMPVVLALMGMAGLVTSRFLRSGRRYAIVIVFVVAALVTPPDPISMMSLALPGLLLYEISILCVWLIERRRAREDAAAEAAEAGAA